MEKETGSHQLPFLDVLVECNENKFSTSIYRKPTFSGDYTRWDSFAPLNHKLQLIDMLAHRAISICSSSKITDELDKIRSIFRDIGYPPATIESRIKYKISNFSSSPIRPLCPGKFFLHKIGLKF